jgi:hypothetical protein
MSICRFFWDGSDVYLFHHVGGYWCCCGCRLSDTTNWRCGLEETDTVVDHLDEHVAAGHVVPIHAYEAFDAEHPDPERFRKARDAWRETHEEEYGWMWRAEDGA